MTDHTAHPDDEQAEPCGENMCHCHCGGGHVCTCDCWHCDVCGQGSENCQCEDEDDDEEWQEGDCDNCYGETVTGPPAWCTAPAPSGRAPHRRTAAADPRTTRRPDACPPCPQDRRDRRHEHTADEHIPTPDGGTTARTAPQGTPAPPEPR